MYSRYHPLRVQRWASRYTVVRIKFWKAETEELVQDGAESGLSTIGTAHDISQGLDQDLKTNSHLYCIQHLYQSCLRLYCFFSDYAEGSINDVPGPQEEANLQYFYETLQETLETAVDLNESGSLSQHIGKSKREILEEIRELHQKLPRHIQLTAGRSMTSSLYFDRGCSAPRWFIVLPSDLDAWLDMEPATHSFRLYFLCESQHVHLSSHQGYDLKRPQEFFQKYGDYVLRLLTMVKYGLPSQNFRFSALHTFNIFQGCDPKVISQFLSREVIRSLIDKAIAYLQDLSPPRRRDAHLLPSETREIAQYLDVHDGDNSFGNLCRHFTSNIYVTQWQCRHHSQAESSSKGLDELQKYVRERGRHIDMVQSTILVDLASDQQVDEFLNRLLGAKHIFAIHVRFNSGVERSCLKRFLQGSALTSVASLEIEGVTLESHSLDHVQYGRDACAEALLSGQIGMIRLLNYPRTGAQYIYIGDDYHAILYGLQCEPSSNMDYIDWFAVESELRKCSVKIMDGMRVATPSLAVVSRDLKLALERHGVSVVTAVSLQDSSMRFSLDLEKEAPPCLQLYDHPVPSSMASISSQLTVDILRPDLDDIFNKCPRLLQLNIIPQESRLLMELEDFIKHGQSQSGQLHLTTFERSNDSQGRILAQVDIRGRSHRDGNINNDSSLSIPACFSTATPSLSEFAVFSQWSCEYISETLSDYTTSLLDLATFHDPSALKAFTLDISLLSQQSLSIVQRLLRRSSLEHLIIMSNHVLFPWRDSIRQVLAAAQTSPLNSIVFSGDSVDEWLQLWESSEVHQPVNNHNDNNNYSTSFPFGPCLQRLELIRPGTVPQTLSHASVLFLHRALYTNVALEMHLENVWMDGRGDWELLARG